MKANPTVSVAASADLPPAPAGGGWHPDILEGFEALTLALSAEPLEGESEVVATLVRRTTASDPQRDERELAVLSLPGWNDYFFHPHVARFFEGRGVTFYALDPRRSGRSLRNPEFRDYVSDLADYAEELDAAVAHLEERHARVVLLAHSTGGATAALWAASRPGRLAGLALNSPWIAMWGLPGYDAVLLPPLSVLAKRDPLSRLKVPDPGDRYGRSIHVSLGGEFDYDLDLKTLGPVPVRLGWVTAVLRAHRRVARGLDIDCPVFVACSTRTLRVKEWVPDSRVCDTVLDAGNIAARAHRLGRLVTIVRIDDGFHDLSLSVPAAREHFLAELGRWLDGYVVT